MVSGKKDRNSILMLLDNDFTSDVRVDKEAVALSNAGYQVTVCCVRGENLSEYEDRNGYRINRCIEDGFNTPFKSIYKTSVQKSINNVLEHDFSILHCHDFYMLSLGAEIKKKNPSTMLIYDSHEFLSGWPYYKTATRRINKFKGRIVWYYLNLLEKKSAEHVDGLITVTEEIGRRLKRRFKLKCNPTIIGNPPEKLNVEKDKSYFRDLYGLRNDIKILLHSGTIYQSDEQLLALFDVIKSSDNLALVFLGNRPRFFEVKKMVERRDELINKVFFHDYLKDQKENIKILANGDVGLMHVRDSWEAHRITYSNRFVEYIMAELPVVATHQLFAEEINNKFSCCSFYEENNDADLKKSIEKIVNDLPEYTKNAKSAKVVLNWENEASKLIDFYNSLNASI